MFSDGYAGRGADDCDRRRNVKSIKPVSARAANIQDFSGAGFQIDGRPNGLFAQRTRKGRNLVDRFAFEREMAEEICLARCRNGFIHQLLNSKVNLFLAQMV